MDRRLATLIPKSHTNFEVNLLALRSTRVNVANLPYYIDFQTWSWEKNQCSWQASVYVTWSPFGLQFRFCHSEHGCLPVGSQNQEARRWTWANAQPFEGSLHILWAKPQEDGGWFDFDQGEFKSVYDMLPFCCCCCCLMSGQLCVQTSSQISL